MSRVTTVRSAKTGTGQEVGDDGVLGCEIWQNIEVINRGIESVDFNST